MAILSPDPSPQEIRARTQNIRQTWDEITRCKRAGTPYRRDQATNEAETVQIPVVGFHEVDGGLVAEEVERVL